VGQFPIIHSFFLDWIEIVCKLQIKHAMVFQRRLTPIQVARELRKNMTLPEQILWNELRNKKLNGHKFLRQHPIVYDKCSVPVRFYVLDFYCDAAKIGIELDGEIHNKQLDYDKLREDDLRCLGIRILRIKNHEIEDIKEVKRKVLKFMEY
jgi:very-short-patch-repair endonuclease